MGGHGGLNILPQKSWNVYGRENREKVKRDEQQHEEEQRKKEEKRLQAESEYRRQFLLQRALQKEQAQDTSGGAQPLHPAGPAEPPLEAAEHINFFKEHEVLAANEEAEEEKKKAQKARGDPKTNTSDARFDERFQLAHGLFGKGSQPWYAQRGSTLPEEDFRTTQLTLGLPSENVRQIGSPAANLLLEAPSKEKKSKHHKQSKDKKKRKEKHSSKVAGGVQKKSVDQLREERRQREEAERVRQRKVLLGHAVAQLNGEPEGGKKFHSSFGNAAAKKIYV